ncbi:uncharacterized protein [Montipora foliosa]|uniref:uncharacterized protein n=1 Tax=Montipora foliosa TaxID=591990 RepID=UPI0035F1B7D1
MDKFSISWEAYHELTQQDQTLSRSYLVEGCQATLDSTCNMHKTPGNQPGAELPLEDLLKEQIEERLKNSSQQEKVSPTERVKISGDGTRMSHSISLFVCSFSILDKGQHVLSSAGNHTIAVVKTSENYNNLKHS